MFWRELLKPVYIFASFHQLVTDDGTVSVEQREQTGRSEGGANRGRGEHTQEFMSSNEVFFTKKTAGVACKGESGEENLGTLSIWRIWSI